MVNREEIEKIVDLNKEAVDIVHKEGPEGHDKAMSILNIARQMGESTHPDAYALSAANMAYAMRHNLGVSDDVFKFLSDSFDKHGRLFSGLRNMTSFGNGRLNEEIGFTYRYDTDDDKVSNLQASINRVTVAEEQYRFARKHPHEVMPEPLIWTHHIRSMSVGAACHVEYAEEYAGDDAEEHLEKALGLATQAMNERLKRHDIDAANKVDSFHTMGAVHTLRGRWHPESYTEAASFLEMARNEEINREETRSPMVLSVLDFRKVWLDYQRGEHSVLAVPLDRILTDDKGHWTPGVAGVLRPKIEEVANHIGGDYPAKVQEYLTI